MIQQPITITAPQVSDAVENAERMLDAYREIERGLGEQGGLANIELSTLLNGVRTLIRCQIEEREKQLSLQKQVLRQLQTGIVTPTGIKVGGLEG
jgi:hypothetical protein